MLQTMESSAMVPRNLSVRNVVSFQHLWRDRLSFLVLLAVEVERWYCDLQDDLAVDADLWSF